MAVAVSLDYSKPHIMGVINVNSDSFYAASRYNSLAKVLSAVETMLSQGASIIDIGAESTRPEAQGISVAMELERIVPVVTAVYKEFSPVISVDTSNPEVMQAACCHGAAMLNDVRALAKPGALAMAAKLNVPVCIMHMQGTPQTMQQDPRYTDVVAEVAAFFAAKIAQCESVGILRQNIILDPGIGFGKTLQHNLKLLQKLGQFSSFGLPLMVGLSRKSFIGKVLDLPVTARLAGSIGAAVIAYANGARIIRTHDVAATYDAIKVAAAIDLAKDLE